MKTILVLALLLAVSMVLSLGFGSVSIPPERIVQTLMSGSPDTAGTNGMVLYTIRMPRTLFAVCAGAGLSLAGLLLQTITRNELADPYVLGVSSGASTGAVCAIIWGAFAFLGAYAVPFSALLGATVATVLAVFFVGRSSNPTKLVLIGMGMSALFSALTMLVIYSANHEAQVRSAMFWLLGSLSGIAWGDLPLAAIVCLGIFTFLQLVRHELDILLLGESEAHALGISVKKLQLAAVAALVAKAGIIGFVGLIVPHIARILSGVKHGRLTVVCTLLGGCVLLWADVLSRTLFRPEELPIGVLTACLGAPLFIWIICRRYGDAYD
ncbi:iron ABC transporter permease [uncultured Selenomonas sp.]|uniref:FecCD family ABC transporter permease n=1 Tax=uncultured Selenomonas sp. TaxID=159275 RepID=UPI00258EEA68|nr:iron ABC transporter permease [uncultured Selenomonas sp.]